MAKGQLALVLNAHLPFVRHPEHPRFLEERWLFEALSETYLPLLRLFRRLEADAVPFRLTMTVSPTLASMLGDKLLGERYAAYLETQLRLASAEEERLGSDPVFGPVVRLYSALYREDREDFETLYGRDVLGGLDFFYKKGRIDLITTGATHAFLPLYADSPEAVSAQIEAAMVAHRRAFGKHPAGFWLPQLGWHPMLADALRAYNVQYTVVTTRGALLGSPTPHRGSFAPVQCPSGLTVFVRDAAATKAVWSESEGYPADPVYRDFYRDIGFDLPLEYLAPYLEEDRARIFTGLKYWAITGSTADKQPYDPAAALVRVREHAANFLAERSAAAERAAPHMDRAPLMVCPYDAELFGHGWFEGIHWLESLFRQAEEFPLGIVSLSEYLRAYPESQVSMPEFSSWGDGGYAEVWLDGSNDWTYRHTFKAVERMTELAERFPDESGLRERILNQAGREVVLSMCSDWSLLMRAGKASSFARRQVEDSISNFGKLYDMLCSNTVGTEWLTRLEKRNNIFPDLNYRIFRKKR
ncbi:MAG TPA: 1,4-alpha-glucan branching protein domain-containing protein [Rectinemataceae bacterium]|nr:1,4-alpha-glucan branching protein domain-containing protein [Rectinemataceae bacterium]